MRRTGAADASDVRFLLLLNPYTCVPALVLRALAEVELTAELAVSPLAALVMVSVGYAVGRTVARRRHLPDTQGAVVVMGSTASTLNPCSSSRPVNLPVPAPTSARQQCSAIYRLNRRRLVPAPRRETAGQPGGGVSWWCLKLYFDVAPHCVPAVRASHGARTYG